jgi:hypothetical protein
MDDASHLLMTHGVTATCADCGDERLFVPVEEASWAGEFCCTSCDAAVFLASRTHHERRVQQVAGRRQVA